MAKVLFSAAVGDARGAIGGIVFTASPTGPAIRRRTAPRISSSPQTLAIRGSASRLAQMWGATLSAARRSNWRVMAATYPRTDVFGRTVYLNGLQMFLSVNQALHDVGEAYILDPPPSYSAGNPITATAAWNAVGPTLTITPGSPPGAHDIPVVWATRPLSPGRNVAGANLRRLEYFTAADPGPYDIAASYLARYGTPPTGHSAFFRLRYTDDVSGKQGTEALCQVLFL